MLNLNQGCNTNQIQCKNSYNSVETEWLSCYHPPIAQATAILSNGGFLFLILPLFSPLYFLSEIVCYETVLLKGLAKIEIGQYYCHS